MKLTAEHHPESIKRYSHIKSVRRGAICRQLCPGTTHICSRARGHRGPHVAHGLFRKVVAVWDLGDARPERASRDAPARGERRPVGLRSRSPVSFLEAVRDLVRQGLSSAEELAWLAFFIAFVGFAVGGFLLIYLG